ncbi:MAG: hypothetical protein AAF317_12150 [Pseudomonadota bacterium]
MKRFWFGVHSDRGPLIRLHDSITSLGLTAAAGSGWTTVQVAVAVISVAAAVSMAARFGVGALFPGVIAVVVVLFTSLPEAPLPVYSVEEAPPDMQECRYGGIPGAPGGGLPPGARAAACTRYLDAPKVSPIYDNAFRLNAVLALIGDGRYGAAREHLTALTPPRSGDPIDGFVVFYPRIPADDGLSATPRPYSHDAIASLSRAVIDCRLGDASRLLRHVGRMTAVDREALAGRYGLIDLSMEDMHDLATYWALDHCPDLDFLFSDRAFAYCQSNERGC